VSKKLITKISWHKINKSVKQDKCKQYGRNNDIYYIDVCRILRFPSDFTFSFSVIRRLKKEFVFNWRRLDNMFDCDVGTPTSWWTMHFYFRVKYQYLFHLETSVFCIHLYNKYPFFKRLITENENVKSM
jgi:hypothetical protein